jgi:hypothetical protein
MLYDAFICHASEDKASFVRPLAAALSGHHLAIWYDEFSLNVGDSLRQAIDEGLTKSRFGIVVLSRAFFKKGWPQLELNGLVARQIAEDRMVILPIWHDITRHEILRISPPLADLVAINSTRGIRRVCTELLKRLRPEESPLIIARDELIKYGYDPPIISDEYWLDIVELMESEIHWRNSSRPWIFPLLHRGYVTGKKRGVNIAWTVMQLEWADEAEEKKICQITHPEIIHDFLRRFSGLSEICHLHPDYLACYAPQLLIPEFSGAFGSDFDRLLITSMNELRQRRDAAVVTDTVLGDDKQLPLCDKRLALRHPTFGNVAPGEVVSKYVSDHVGGSHSKCFEWMDYLVWLLSDQSTWLPEKHREFLILGMQQSPSWCMGLPTNADWNNPFIKKLYSAKSAETFRFTTQVRRGLEDMIAASLKRLGFQVSVSIIADSIIERELVKGFFELRNPSSKRARNDKLLRQTG